MEPYFDHSPKYRERSQSPFVISYEDSPPLSEIHSTPTPVLRSSHHQYEGKTQPHGHLNLGDSHSAQKSGSHNRVKSIKSFVSWFQKEPSSVHNPLPPPPLPEAAVMEQVRSSPPNLGHKGQRKGSYWELQRESESLSASPRMVPRMPRTSRSHSIHRNHVRPELHQIYRDRELLNALTHYMTKQYMSENILFLQAANSLIAKIDAFIAASEFQDFDTAEIDFEILSIYNKFIRDDAQNEQINLSYSCGAAIDALFGYDNFQNCICHGLTLQQKRTIFDQCIVEIERLMQTSVLPVFFQSDLFHSIMERRSHLHRPTLLKAKSMSAMGADRHSYAARMDHHQRHNDLHRHSHSHGSHGRRHSPGPHLGRHPATPTLLAPTGTVHKHSPKQNRRGRGRDGPRKSGNGSPAPKPRRKKSGKIVSLKPPGSRVRAGIDQQSTSSRYVKTVLHSIDFDAVRPILPQFEQFGTMGLQLEDDDDDDDLVDVNDSIFDDTPPSNHLQLSYTPKLSLKQSETPLAWMDDDDPTDGDPSAAVDYSKMSTLAPPTDDQSSIGVLSLRRDRDRHGHVGGVPAHSHPLCSDHDEEDTVTDHESVLEDDGSTVSGSQLENQRIARYLVQRKMPKQLAHVHFDKVTESVTVSSAGTPRPRVCLLDSHGLRSGLHEWEIEVMQIDVMLQEIGVIGTPHIEHVRIQKQGIIATRNLGPRAVFGNELRARSLYYASINQDDTKRCQRDLKMLMGWREHDVIRVCLDLNKWRIKYYINGQKVGKPMSLQPRAMYFPVIAFTGNCRYRLRTT